MFKKIIKRILLNGMLLLAVPVLFSITSCYKGEGDLLDPARGIDVQNNGGSGIQVPSDFSATYDSGTTTATFSWNYYSGNVEGFQLQIDTAMDGTYATSYMIPYSGSSYSYDVIVSLTAGYTYSCRIRAGKISTVSYSDWVNGSINFGVGVAYIYSSTIDFSSSFGEIYGICIDTAGNIYVPDSTYGYLRVINPPYTTYYIMGSFIDTRGVAVNSITGTKYVVTNGGSYVYVYDNYDSYVGVLAVTLSSPQDCAVDSSGYVYIADTGNHQIIKYNTGDDTYIQWGGNGSGNGQFSYPGGVEADSNGNIYVCDSGNHRIQKFDSSGNYITQWGLYGSAVGEFYEPRGIAIDGSNNIYIADSYNNRIQKFDSDGNYITDFNVGYYVNGVAVTSDGGTVYACAGSYGLIIVYSKSSK